jgi:hypothetical protein
VGISRDYPLKTRTSKQPIGEILGFEIIPSHPLKYPRSKQGRSELAGIVQTGACLLGRFRSNGSRGTQTNPRVGVKTERIWTDSSETIFVSIFFQIWNRSG